NTYSLPGPSCMDPSYAVYSNGRDWLVAKNVTNQTEWASLFPTSGGIYQNPPQTQTMLMGKLNRTILDPQTAEVLKGNSSFRIEFSGFTPTDDANARAVVYGTVFGLAGTDYEGRDLLVALPWGAPVGSAVGVAGALAS